MIEIHMDNVYAKCYNLPQSIANILAQKLSFEVGGFGVPTETKAIFDIEKHSTYTGLVPHIIQILHKLNLKYTIKDTRVKPQSNAEFNLLPPYELRDYQEEIVNRASSRELIQAATGAGKTFIMYSLIRKFGVKPVVVIAPKVSLAEQIKEEFEKFSGHKIGIVGGGYHDIQDITVCTPMSAPEDLLKECKGIYYDECMSYDTKVLMENGKYKKIGDLVKEKSNERVMSYNHQTGEMEPKKIISHSKTPLKKNNKKLMKLTIRKADGTKEVIECTDNHKIWVESLGKYVKAGDLVKNQKVKVLNKKDN